MDWCPYLSIYLSVIIDLNYLLMHDKPPSCGAAGVTNIATFFWELSQGWNVQDVPADIGGCHQGALSILQVILIIHRLSQASSRGGWFPRG